MSNPIDASRTELEARLKNLVDEYLRLADPSAWPKLDTISQQQQAYWQRRHREQLLREVRMLQGALANAPRQAARAGDDSDTGRLISAAKAKAKELRERAGLLAPKVTQ